METLVSKKGVLLKDVCEMLFLQLHTTILQSNVLFFPPLL